jgi:two-component system NarL family response regulator
MGFRDARRVSEAQAMGLRVFIVDQERTFADALASRLEAEGEIVMVAAVSAARPALPPVVAQDADIMLLDADLPGDAAFTLCREVARCGPAAHVIMLSYSVEPERVTAAMLAGAAAWMPKGESLECLLRVMHGVVQGESWLPPAVTGHVLTLLLRGDAPQRGSDLLLAPLTPREREVLACLAEGAARREVAARLGLSANTVRTHTQNLMAKLQVHSALKAVALTRSELRAAAPAHAHPRARAGGPPRW